MENIICRCGKGYASQVDGMCRYCRENQYRRAECKAVGVRHQGDGLTLEQESRIKRGNTMSNGFDNTNSGALFKNDKRGNERSPEYKGECAPVCPHCGKKSEFWLSAWIKTMKKDATKKFMSLALTPKDEPKNQSQQNYNAPPADFDDDIPFD